MRQLRKDHEDLTKQPAARPTLTPAEQPSNADSAITLLRHDAPSWPAHCGDVPVVGVKGHGRYAVDHRPTLDTHHRNAQKRPVRGRGSYDHRERRRFIDDDRSGHTVDSEVPPPDSRS